MSIYRWMKDESLGFPKPALRVNRLRYWRASDVSAWIADRAEQAAA